VGTNRPPLGLSPVQLPQAVHYLYTILRATDGQLQRVEIQYRPAGERHVFRAIDPSDGDELVSTDRPQGWDRQRELWAMEDLRTSIENAQGDEPVG